MQLSAIGTLGREGEEEFLRLVNEMRKNSEKIDARTSNRMCGIFWSACVPRNQDRSAQVFAAVPITEHLVTFRALFYGNDFDKSRARERDACLAALVEAAGQREEALQVWVTLRQGFSPADREWRDRAEAAIKRLSPQHQEGSGATACRLTAASTLPSCKRGRNHPAPGRRLSGSTD